MKNYPKGSEWRRWDLHLHTASSYDHKFKAPDSDNELCKSLISNDIAAVAITDHFIIDKDRIANLRELAPDIVFFPGVELRTDKGDTNIHIILIFSTEIPIEELVEDFNSFKRTGKNHDKFETCYWDFNSILNFVKDKKVIMTIHAGRKSNGLDDRITNALPHNQAVKEEYASNIDIFEMGQLRDLEEYEKKVFSSGVKRRPMIICSDNHDGRDYNPSQKLWIKTDPTFNGLKQACIEHERFFVGELPPALDRIYKNKTKTLKDLKINWSDSYTGHSGEWFKNIHLEFNPEMTAIIGNKGSGKTAIAEIIGLLCNSKNEEQFIFLNENKFRKKKLASNFDAILGWHSGTSVPRNLGVEVDSNSSELVHFVPQKSFEQFCNDSDEAFQTEIENVVFSRMPEEEKLGHSSFYELIESQKIVITKRKAEILIKITELNQQIMKLEIKRDQGYKSSVENSNKQLSLELKEHEKVKPVHVEIPAAHNSPEYQLLMLESSSLEEQIKIEKEKLQLLFQNDAQLKLIHQKLNNIKNQLDDSLKECQAELEKYKIDMQDIFQFKFDFTKINEELTVIADKIKQVNTLISEDPDSIGELVFKQNELNIKIEQCNKDNEGKLSQYQKYLFDTKEWDIRNIELNKKKEEFKTEIAYLGDFITSPLISDINLFRKKRFEKVEQVFECINEEVQIYDKFKASIIEFIGKYKIQMEDYDVKIETGVYPKDDFINTFVETYINSSIAGPFRTPEGAALLRRMVQESDFQTFEGLSTFLSRVQDEFDGKNAVCYHSMFKKGKYDNFIDMFYSLKFLDARYSLQLHGKPLYELSPGERGGLLLVFYLLLDARDTPLILDQPEDNLDNESVAKILVPFIRDAKKRRQIVIITHNANLAVVADAEQIIRVKLDKQKGNKFSFVSGSLESRIIDDVVNVLEGTKNSFSIRKNKYNF